MLYAPEDCILYKHPVMNCLLAKRNLFLVSGAFISGIKWHIDRIIRHREEGKPLSYEEKELFDIAINLAMAEDVVDGLIPKIRRSDMKEILDNRDISYLNDKYKRIMQEYQKKSFPKIDSKCDEVYNLILSMRKQFVQK